MSSTAIDLKAPLAARLHLASAAIGVLFVVLFAQPLVSVARDWWSDPDAAHGLLLAPLALYFAWRKGRIAVPRPATWLGLAMLVAAVLVRYVSGLAAELFTMRMSMVLGVAGITAFYLGWRQLTAWWLPFTLVVLAIPLPDIILSAVAFPLQLEASQMGAALLAARDVPVMVSGNVIRIPGQELFVTEACSGLRSLTALVSLGVLLGATMLAHPVSRVLLLAVAIPIAILVNAVRVFLTGFAVFFISPKAGEGLMHLTEGWLLFVVSFGILVAITKLGSLVEGRLMRASA